MDNLESDWDFSGPSIILAETSDHFALRICAVDLKNEPKTAETLIKIQRCLAAAQISVEVTDIKAKPSCEGAKSTLKEIFVAAPNAKQDSTRFHGSQQTVGSRST